MSASTMEALFNTPSLVDHIRQKLPTLFRMAEIECSRDGKIGMEVGNLRERILIAMLRKFLGDSNVNYKISATEPEVDVICFQRPVSIKTITAKRLDGVKLSWTVDPDMAKKFLQNYEPKCDIFLAHISWGGSGGLYFVPQYVQVEMLRSIGRRNYIKLPKEGTNPRGVTFENGVMEQLVSHSGSFKNEFIWKMPRLDYDPYKRWMDKWC